MKSKKSKPACVIENCTFNGARSSSEAEIQRAQAVKAIAEALGKAADALKENQPGAPMLSITQPGLDIAPN